VLRADSPHGEDMLAAVARDPGRRHCPASIRP
jgi:hypothetical protein